MTNIFNQQPLPPLYKTFTSRPENSEHQCFSPRPGLSNKVSVIDTTKIKHEVYILRNGYVFIFMGGTLISRYKETYERGPFKYL